MKAVHCSRIPRPVGQRGMGCRGQVRTLLAQGLGRARHSGRPGTAASLVTLICFNALNAEQRLQRCSVPQESRPPRARSPGYSQLWMPSVLLVLYVIVFGFTCNCRTSLVVCTRCRNSGDGNVPATANVLQLVSSCVVARLECNACIPQFPVVGGSARGWSPLSLLCVLAICSFMTAASLTAHDCSMDKVHDPSAVLLQHPAHCS